MFIAGINLLSLGEICMMAHFHSSKNKEEEKTETTTGTPLIETATSQFLANMTNINNFKL